jgi:hypothetical protein
MYSLIHNNPQLYTLMIVIIEHTYAFMAAIAAYIHTHKSCNNNPHVLVFIETWSYAHQTKHFFLYFWNEKIFLFLKKLVESGYFNIGPIFYSVSIQSRY